MNRETTDKQFFEQCLLLSKTGTGSLSKAKGWKTAKAAATTFERRMLLWGITPRGSPEETNVWKMIKEKAKTFGECRLVWKITPSNPPKKKAAALKRVRVKKS